MLLGLGHVADFHDGVGGGQHHPVFQGLEVQATGTAPAASLCRKARSSLRSAADSLIFIGIPCCAWRPAIPACVLASLGGHPAQLVELGALIGCQLPDSGVSRRLSCFGRPGPRMVRSARRTRTRRMARIFGTIIVATATLALFTASSSEPATRNAPATPASSGMAGRWGFLVIWFQSLLR